jgi:hypothetical protein
LCLFGVLVYFAYITFFPQTVKKSRKHRTVPTHNDSVASGTGGYQEEWIPEHHLRKGKGKGAASSGDLSGGDTSGTESRRRKAKK